MFVQDRLPVVTLNGRRGRLTLDTLAPLPQVQADLAALRAEFDALIAGAGTDLDTLAEVAAAIGLLQLRVSAMEASIGIAVDVATTGPVNLASLAAGPVDGQTLDIATTLLVRAQANAVENGIYVRFADGWQRLATADTLAELRGRLVTVRRGLTLANTAWMIRAGSQPVVGTDAIHFDRLGSQSETIEVVRPGVTPNSQQIALDWVWDHAVDSIVSGGIVIQANLVGASSTIPLTNSTPANRPTETTVAGLLMATLNGTSQFLEQTSGAFSMEGFVSVFTIGKYLSGSGRRPIFAVEIGPGNYVQIQFQALGGSIYGFGYTRDNTSPFNYGGFLSTADNINIDVCSILIAGHAKRSVMALHNASQMTVSADISANSWQAKTGTFRFGRSVSGSVFGGGSHRYIGIKNWGTTSLLEAASRHRAMHNYYLGLYPGLL